MNKWKISFFVLLFVLLASNAFWFYGIIDQGVTITYQQVTIDDQKESIKALANLIVQNSQKLNQKDILYLLRNSSPDAFIVEKENIISCAGLKFEFENGQLKEISRQ